MKFDKPPHWQNTDGKERKVGFEFEIARSDTKTCSEMIAQLFGGNVSYNHSLESEITNTQAGTFKVQLDAQIVLKLAADLEKDKPNTQNQIIDMNKLRAHLSAWIGSTAEKIVPLEVITPPMTFDQFPEIENLRKQLLDKNAEGTKAAFVNAFGMHINPEMPSQDVRETCDILRAFLLLSPWLMKVMDIDLTRRILSYIDPFPAPYIKKVLAKNYSPDWEEFIADYLADNPTRNRALDLLPLFAHVRPDSLKLLDKEDRKLTKARPTFHYRLPNCDIDNPDWRIAREWNYWVEIEKLADDKEKLSKMASEYLIFMDKPLHIFSNDWIKKITSEFGYAQK